MWGGGDGGARGGLSECETPHAGRGARPRWCTMVGACVCSLATADDAAPHARPPFASRAGLCGDCDGQRGALPPQGDRGCRPAGPAAAGAGGGASVPGGAARAPAAPRPPWGHSTSSLGPHSAPWAPAKGGLTNTLLPPSLTRVCVRAAQHTTTIYLHDQIAQYGQELAAKMPGNLKVVYFVNSGRWAGGGSSSCPCHPAGRQAGGQNG